MDDTLDRVHVVLQLCDLTNWLSEGSLRATDVAERDTSLRRRDGDDESEKEAEYIDPDAGPALIRDCQPVDSREGGSVFHTPSGGGVGEPALDVHPILTLFSRPVSLAMGLDGSQTSERLREMSTQR